MKVMKNNNNVFRLCTKLNGKYYLKNIYSKKLGNKYAAASFLYCLDLKLIPNF